MLAVYNFRLGNSDWGLPNFQKQPAIAQSAIRIPQSPIPILHSFRLFMLKHPLYYLELRTGVPPHGVCPVWVLAEQIGRGAVLIFEQCFFAGFSGYI
jgi:hypothetical protein